MRETHRKDAGAGVRGPITWATSRKISASKEIIIAKNYSLLNM